MCCHSDAACRQGGSESMQQISELVVRQPIGSIEWYGEIFSAPATGIEDPQQMRSCL
jgi:hypothetical protein